MLRTVRAALVLGLVPLALFASVGCAEYDLANGADTGPGDTGDSTEVEDTDSVDDTDFGPEPVYFALDGVIDVSGGEAQAVTSTLTFTFWPTDTSAAENSVCTWSPPVTAMTPETPSDSTVPLYGWWSVTLDASDLGSCPATAAAPDFLRIGIGALDTQLYPAMDSNALDPSDNALYAVYTQYGTIAAPIYVYGVAGTAENYAGTNPPADAAPLPDGSYSIQSLHLLPIGPSTR